MSVPAVAAATVARRNQSTSYVPIEFVETGRKNGCLKKIEDLREAGPQCRSRVAHPAIGRFGADEEVKTPCSPGISRYSASTRISQSTSSVWRGI